MSSSWGMPVVKNFSSTPDSTSDLRKKTFSRPESTFVQPMEVEDLSVKKETYKGCDISSRAHALYSPKFVSNETIDLSTKRKDSDAAVPAVETPSSEGTSSEILTSPRKLIQGSGLKYTVRSHTSRGARAESHSMSMSSNSSPDVIVLSDEDGPRLNGHINGFDSRPESPDSDGAETTHPPQRTEFTEEELKDRHALIRRLRENLRNEEMKLVLLKKVRQSQLLKETIPGTKIQGTSPSSNMTVARTPNVGPPPPLVRGSHSHVNPMLVNKPMVQQPSLPAGTVASPVIRNQGLSSSGGTLHQPMLVGPRGNNNALMLQPQQLLRPVGVNNAVNASRAPVSTPPNVVMGYTITTQNNQVFPSQGTTVTTAPSHTVTTTTPVDNQTPAQRQAAAKLALRKQLEKTLLQIPPPKPPPPEMHFIPNANNPEFVYLLGLETVVNFLTDDPDLSRAPAKPFDCVQCNTDFTPVWKWQDANSISAGKRPSVICEMCVTSNIKKALKAEHTNRLKTAFVKALQQEQEIEQRMAQGGLPSPPPASTPPTTSTPTPPAAPPTAHSPVPGSIPRLGLLPQMPKLPASQHSLLHAQAQQLHQAQAHQLQQLAQSLPQPQPAHMLPFAPLLAQAYPYQMLGKSPLASDLQRQYLLDMIPSRSMAQGSVNWKT